MASSGYVALVEQDTREIQTKLLRYVALLEQSQAAEKAKDERIAALEGQVRQQAEENDDLRQENDDLRHELDVVTGNYQDALARLEYDPIFQDHDELTRRYRDLREELDRRDQKNYEQELKIAGLQAELEFRS